MRKLNKIILAVALAGGSITAANSKLAKSDYTDLREVQSHAEDERSEANHLSILTAANNVRNAVNTATLTSKDPEVFWDLIPNADKTNESINQLLRNPSPEFLRFLQATAESGYDIEYLRDKNIFDIQLYRNFINVEHNLNRKIPAIENGLVQSRSEIVNSSNITENSIRRARYASRQEQQLAARTLSTQFNQENRDNFEFNTDLPRDSNLEIYPRYLNAIFDEANRIQSDGLSDRPEPSRYSRMTQSAVNPALAYSVMMLETFPRDNFHPSVLFNLNQILMNSGYQPSQRVADSNNHLTMGLNHTSYNTFRNYVNQSHRQNPQSLQFLVEPDELSTTIESAREFVLPTDDAMTEQQLNTVGQFIAMVNNPNISANLFYGLTFHNLNSFENFLRNLDPETKSKALNFIQNPNNITAFLAIAMHFNEKGSIVEEHRKILNLLIESDFNANIFLNRLRATSSYVNRGIIYLEYLLSVENLGFNNLNSNWGYEATDGTQQ